MQELPHSTSGVNTQPIDVVISWVDGREPEHIATRAKYSDIYNGTDGNANHNPLAAEVNAPRRWSYANELDICLRSIQHHAPWINRIFIVTNGQVPKNLEGLPKELQSKVEIIDHRVIFRDNLDWLPTFNSMAIEAMMWRIPDLAERFIYFNDDMFLAGPCKPELFFNEGATTLMGKWMSVSSSQKHKFTKSIYRAAKLNAATVMGYDAARFFSSAHVAMPMRVSAMKAIYAANPELFDRNARSQFRGADQYLVQGLFAHHILKLKTTNLPKRRFDQNMSASYCKRIPYWVFKINCAMIKFWPKRFRLICVNDLSLLNERFGGKADIMIRRAIGIN